MTPESADIDAALARLGAAFQRMADQFLAAAQAALLLLRHLSDEHERVVRRAAERAGITSADIRAIHGTVVLTWNRRRIDVREHLEAQ